MVQNDISAIVQNNLTNNLLELDTSQTSSKLTAANLSITVYNPSVAPGVTFVQREVQSQCHPLCCVLTVP